MKVEVPAFSKAMNNRMVEFTEHTTYAYNQCSYFRTSVELGLVLNILSRRSPIIVLYILATIH